MFPGGKLEVVLVTVDQSITQSLSVLQDVTVTLTVTETNSPSIFNFTERSFFLFLPKPFLNSFLITLSLLSLFSFL